MVTKKSDDAALAALQAAGQAAAGPMVLKNTSRNPRAVAGHRVQVDETVELTAEQQKDERLMQKVRHSLKLGALTDVTGV
jgi:hypothetical protein